MSTQRLRRGGRIAPEALPIGPSGRRLCRYCQEREVPARRRTFCSPRCVREYRLRTDKDYVRRCVFARDRGRCARCGADTVALLKSLDREWKGIVAMPAGRPKQSAALAFKEANPDFFRRESFWDAHHITPVCEGGGECGLENYQTLCLHCHRTTTAELNQERARARRGSSHAA